MQEAVLGMSTTLAVKNMKQLKWSGNKYAYVVMNDTENVVMQIDPRTFEPEVAISLEKMNKDLARLNCKPLKKFPELEWINQKAFYIQHDQKLIRFVVSPSDSMRTDILNEIPESAENLSVHPITLDIAYTENNQLLWSTGPGKKSTITQDGSKDIQYGSSVHRNEFGIEHGIFWSPSGKALAFYRMDQSMVEDYPINNWNETPAKANLIKYPFSGRTSHQVTIGVYRAENASVVYLQTGEPKEQYLTSVTWSPDEKLIYVGILNRDQNYLKLNSYEALTGNFVKTLFEEKNDRYVEPQHPLVFLNNNPGQFIWWSQRDGFMHLYLYAADGTLIRQLTKGDWLVNEIIGYAATRNELIVTASKESPLQKNVYAVNVKTGAMRMLGSSKGIHTVSLSSDGNFLIDQVQNNQTPRNIEILNLTNNKEKRIFSAPDPLEQINLSQIRNLNLKAVDGTDLYARLMLPANFDENKKYPVIVYLYNGPHVQLNKDGFPASGNLWYDHLTQKGYVVFVLDGRGSSNRGFAFESAIFRQLGTVEMQDQLTGVEYLKSLPFVDATRMGVHGWSFGGFMTTSLMLRHPDVFKVGVAGGPVLDWSLYEIMYTERYMDTPEQNPDGYKNNLLFDKVKNLKGKLLMIHGTDDDVVVWQHSLRFVKKCVDEGVQFDYFVYPGHPHNVRGKDRVHLMQKVTDYFDAVLKP